MNTNSRRGLSILAGGLAFVGSANATDLIVNGSFEAGEGVGWVGHFNPYNYSAAYYRGPAIPESENPGAVYSWQHGIAPGDFSGPCIQTVDITTAAPAADIDAGRGHYTFSAWMASYGQPNANPERPYVTVQFFDAANAPLGTPAVLDRASGSNFVRFADGVTVFDRTDHEHFWAKYLHSGPIPPGARSATVGITRNPTEGLSGSPDTYTDLVKLDVQAVVSPPVITGPTPVTDAVGNTVTFEVSLLGVGPYTYQWRRGSVDLPGQTGQSLSLSNVQLSTAGNYSVRIGYLGGSVTSAPASLTVFEPPPSPVTLQWDFNNSEDTATCGANVDYFDNTVFNASYIVDTDFALLPPVDGTVTFIMHVPDSINGQPSGGYELRHGLAANGGGTNVNQYTLVLDVLYPATSHSLGRALLQTQTENADDAEFRIDESNGLGVNGIYQGQILLNTWHRVALAVDLSGPGPNPVVAKFIDGVKVGQQVLPAGRDSRWSLSTRPDAPFALLFAGLATEVQEGYVSSVQFRSGRLSDAAIAAMGGPSAGKIPGAACALSVADSPVIRWSGSELLRTDSINGQWTPIAGAAKPYPVPLPLDGMKFYRSR